MIDVVQSAVMSIPQVDTALRSIQQCVLLGLKSTNLLFVYNELLYEEKAEYIFKGISTIHVFLIL